MTPFREPGLTLMFTVFLWPLMVHASLGNSGALSSAKGRITSNTSRGWGARAPAQAGRSDEGVTEGLVDNPAPRLWALHSGAGAGADPFITISGL